MKTMADHADSNDKPILVIISGPPGAGKSRLATPLAKQLGLPLLAKDTIKERLADELGSDAITQAEDLGRQAIIDLYASAANLLLAHEGVVIECFFHPGLAEPDLAPLIEASNAVLVHLTADTDLLVDRYRTRMQSSERHPIHNERSPEDVRRYIAQGLGQPLSLDIPVIELDTTWGSIDPAEIAFMIREFIFGEDE